MSILNLITFVATRDLKKACCHRLDCKTLIALATGVPRLESQAAALLQSLQHETGTTRFQTSSRRRKKRRGAISPRWQYWSRIKSLTGFVRAKFFSCYTKLFNLAYHQGPVSPPGGDGSPFITATKIAAQFWRQRVPRVICSR